MPRAGLGISPPAGLAELAGSGADVVAALGLPVLDMRGVGIRFSVEPLPLLPPFVFEFFGFILSSLVRGATPIHPLPSSKV